MLPHFEHILCHCEAFLLSNYPQTLTQCELRVFMKTQDSLDTRRSNVFEFKEKIRSGYINYKKLASKWTFQGGLRIENTASKGYLSFKASNRDSVQSIPRVYTNLFPSLSVSVKTSETIAFLWPTQSA